MKKILIVCSLLVGSVATSMAQYGGGFVTPFTPRVTDSLGRKVYVQPQRKRHPKIAITFGYGYRPVTSLNSHMNDKFPFRENNVALPSSSFVQGDITSTVGPIMVGFSYEFMPWLELNVPFMYQHNNGLQPPTPGMSYESGYFKDDLFIILPNVRLNWLRNNWLSVYTRAGVGLGFGQRYVSVDADDTNKAMFAWHVSPLGVEMGAGRVCFFAEGGWGYMGAISAGVKVKVGRVLSDGRTSKGRKVEWYEKYLR